MKTKTTHTSKYINQNWRIKISGFTGKEKLHTLIGVQRLIDILGTEITDTLINKAENRGIDKINFKFRRGLKITLYSK